jgi:hypothetical protein
VQLRVIKPRVGRLKELVAELGQSRKLGLLPLSRIEENDPFLHLGNDKNV